MSKSHQQKNKKKKSNRSRGGDEDNFKSLTLKDGDQQEYAQVISLSGGSWVKGQCFDGKQRNLHIPGRLRNGRGGKGYIQANDFLLIGLRGFQDSKADIIQKYSSDEVRSLKMQGELPEATSLPENKNEETKDACVFDFENI
jgi:translation initiation factor 1A